MDVADANLVPPTDNHVMKKLDCVASIMKVALDCCAESPARRTNMKDVVGKLQKIRIQLLAWNLSTSLRNFYANNYKIKGRIPNDVGNLSSLLDIDLPGNNLVGLIPTSIGNLRDLQRFNLSSNKFTGFIGDLICKLQHLGDIYLGQNQISGSLPNCLGNITSLREIHLGSNKLSSNIPPSLGNLQDLVVLHLSSNNMVRNWKSKVCNKDGSIDESILK
ncbi:LRR receptor-like serine/threonine-protein kinase RGI5 [Capsicum annuum]|uniref:LRR receptor-like serine/threonine-protein kinase RGI5 n=1 Tax=Capsicum annuum TaxID=4072 RepID=UPI001FB04F99|nr:LRR receptor-like serine/threonine-protein kinase RGI5 [Capsicum annuum]